MNFLEPRCHIGQPHESAVDGWGNYHWIPTLDRNKLLSGKHQSELHVNAQRRPSFVPQRKARDAKADPWGWKRATLDSNPSLELIAKSSVGGCGLESDNTPGALGPPSSPRCTSSFPEAERGWKSKHRRKTSS